MAVKLADVLARMSVGDWYEDYTEEVRLIYEDSRIDPLDVDNEWFCPPNVLGERMVGTSFGKVLAEVVEAAEAWFESDEAADARLHEAVKAYRALGDEP